MKRENRIAVVWSLAICVTKKLYSCHTSNFLNLSSRSNAHVLCYKTMTLLSVPYLIRNLKTWFMGRTTKLFAGLSQIYTFDEYLGLGVFSFSEFRCAIEYDVFLNTWYSFSFFFKKTLIVYKSQNTNQFPEILIISLKQEKLLRHLNYFEEIVRITVTNCIALLIATFLSTKKQLESKTLFYAQPKKNEPKIQN